MTTEATSGWRDAGLSPDQRVRDLMARMTPREKIAQLHGVWVGIDSGGEMAPHEHDFAVEPPDLDELSRRGIGQLTRVFGTRPIAPEVGAHSLARTQRKIIAGNRFDPPGLAKGPYVLAVSVREGRLVLDIRDVDNCTLHVLALALGPFRRLIKDYHLVVEAHERAVAESGPESRVQAIDMGRRGLHNEGAELLQQRLKDRIEVDFETARRLFTLVCALHQRI